MSEYCVERKFGFVFGNVKGKLYCDKTLKKTNHFTGKTSERQLNIHKG